MSTHISINAMRDDITGQVTTLSDEVRPAFERFTLRMLCALQPYTELETFLAHAIAWDYWRLNHLRAIEMNMYTLGTSSSGVVVEDRDPAIQAAMAAATTFAVEAQNLVRMSLCEQRLNRSLHQNLATLRQIQAERQLTDTPDKIGFAFANREISSAMPAKEPA